jgi:hypothetical protein
MTEETIATALHSVWEEFKGKFENKHLNAVLERQFAFSIPEQSEILITGINPSYQLKVADVLLRYRYKSIKHRYFSILRRIVPATIKGALITASYSDLFYYRNTEQAILNDFSKEKQLGIDFLTKQLIITQQIIEWIAPQVILVMNKGSWKFWGKDPKQIWMGYEMTLLQNDLVFGELYLITGLRDTYGRRYSDTKQTTLIGTKIYFSKYLKRVSNINLELIKKEIQSIVDQ